MLGFRGAARYSHPAYAEGFALECAALRRVRKEMGFLEFAYHGAVLPDRRGRPTRARDDGGQWTEARRERA